MSGRSYFYFGGDALHSGIYADLVERLGAEGLTVGLLARLRVSPNPAATWRAWRERHRLGTNRIEDLRARLPGGVELVPVWNLLPALSAPWLARLLRRRAPSGTVVLHTRQVVIVLLGLALRRWRKDLRVIAELEGDDLAELDYKRDLRGPASPLRRLRDAFERRWFDRADRRILNESDAVICVSAILRDVLVRRYALPPERAERLHVITTLATRRDFFFDAGRRERTRRAEGLEGRYVVIYTGNLRGAWQRPDKLAQAFAAIRERRPDAFFLVLTPDSDRRHIEPHLAREGVAPADVRLRSAPHGEIVNFLNAADASLLLRDRHPMNEAAAPGKFGEYALCGLPIVMTEGIGDFSAQMRERPEACVLPDLEFGTEARARLAEFCARDWSPEERLGFSRWAGERFASELAIPRLAALYRGV